MNNQATTLAILLAALLAAQASRAGDDATFDVRAAAGYQHDSNVSVDELDTNTGESDSALRLELDINGNVRLSDSVSVRGGYGQRRTNYSAFSEFDTAIHSLTGEIAWRVAGFDTALALRHFAATLDSDRFLDIRQVSPSAGRLIGRTLYVRGAFTDSDKSYAERGERDASNRAVEVDAYWLLDGMDRYVSLGYRRDTEDARDDELDYNGDRFKLTVGQSLESLPLTLKAQWQLENRDYRNVTEAIGDTRRDRRSRTSLNADWQFSEHVGLEGAASYADYRSNLDGAQFDEVIYSLSLAASF